MIQSAIIQNEIISESKSQKHMLQNDTTINLHLMAFSFNSEMPIGIVCAGSLEMPLSDPNVTTYTTL